MTTQLTDSVRLDGDVHDLVGHDGDDLWQAKAAGVPVVMASTACWRGYVCSYAIVDGRLVLDQLDAMIGRYDDDDRLVPIAPPPINGRVARPLTPGRGQIFNAAYVDLGLALDVTATLVAARDPLGEPDGVEAMPWEYRSVARLDVVRGVLRGRVDLSAAMVEVRAALAAADLDRAGVALDRAGLSWLRPRLRT